MSKIIDKLAQKYQMLGLLGMIENVFFCAHKSLMWLWYIGRFKRRGRNITFEGPITIIGANNIMIGSNVVFGKNVKLISEGEGEITIGDDCFIADNVLISARKKVVIGKGTRIHEFSSMQGCEISLGEDVWVSKFCFIIGADISVGDRSILAPFVQILDTEHYIDPVTGQITMGAGETAPVKIEENAWLGNGAKVMKGVSIGRGSIVGAGAVVTKDIPPGMVAVGVPAKTIKKVVK